MEFQSLMLWLNYMSICFPVAPPETQTYSCKAFKCNHSFCFCNTDNEPLFTGVSSPYLRNLRSSKTKLICKDSLLCFSAPCSRTAWRWPSSSWCCWSWWPWPSCGGSGLCAAPWWVTQSWLFYFFFFSFAQIENAEQVTCFLFSKSDGCCRFESLEWWKIQLHFKLGVCVCFLFSLLQTSCRYKHTLC